MFAEHINTITQKITNFLQSENFLISILLIISFPLICTLLLKLLYNKLRSKFSYKFNFIFALFKVIYIPIVLFIWLYSIYFSCKIKINNPIFENNLFVKNIPTILLTSTIGIILYRFLKYLLSGINEFRTKTNKISLQFINRIISSIIFISVILFNLQISGFNVSIILLFSGGYLVTIIMYIILNTFLRIAYHRIMKKVAQNSHFWIYTIVKSIYMPLHFLILLEAIHIAYKVSTFNLKAPLSIENTAMKLHAILIVILIAWFFMKFIQIFEEQLLLGRLTRKTPSKTTVQATGKLLRVGMVVVLVLISLPIIGIPISGILAFSGGSAIVVGIAVRPILANYFGGLLIFSDRFFEVGDWIHSPDQDIQGTVENIGWRSTRIRTFDKRPLYVPNSVFSSISVINASRMSNRRIQESIGIRYSDASNLGKITQEVRSMLKNHPEIDVNQTLLVHFTDFGPSSLNINVYTFTRTRDWKKYRDVQQDVFLKIINIIENNDSKLAIPGRSIYFNNANNFPEALKNAN